jgi:hypothetical protein
MNTPSFFIESLPKCPEVKGTPDQVFFSKDFGTMVLKLIQTKTITAFGTVTPGSTTLQYLFNPMIHHDLTRNPITIIDNSSNKQEKFSLVKVDIASFHLFPYPGPEHTFDTLLPHGDKLTEELLNDTTNLKLFVESIVATLVPNFFVIYYGQKVLHGDITTNKLKAKMIKLGTGYNLWARIKDKMLSTNKLDNFLMVTGEAKKDPLLICKHFLQSWDPLTSTQLASNNRPCGTITNVQSDDYPHAAQIIKSSFCPTPLHRPSHNHWLCWVRSHSSYPANSIMNPKPNKVSKSSCSSMCVQVDRQ